MTMFIWNSGEMLSVVYIIKQNANFTQTPGNSKTREKPRNSQTRETDNFAMVS